MYYSAGDKKGTPENEKFNALNGKFTNFTTKVTLDDSAWEGSVWNEGTGTTTITLNNGSNWTGNLRANSDTKENKNRSYGTSNITINKSVWTGSVTQNADYTSKIGNKTTTYQDTLNVVLEDGVWNVTAVNTKTSETSKYPAPLHNTLDTLSLKGSSTLSLADGVDFDGGAVTSDNGSKLTLRFESLNATAKLLGNTSETTIVATGTANNGTMTAEEIATTLYSKNLTQDNKTNVKSFTVEQGLVADGATGVYKDGKLDKVVETKNTNVMTFAETTALTMVQWRAEADDLNQRMGELRTSEAANGLWVRTYGGKAEATLADNEFYGFQFGYDHAVNAGADKTFVGGALSYTKGDASFANGTGDNYILGLTGYGTWILENGSYLDLSARYGKLSSDFDLNAGTLGKLNGSFETHGLAVSVEAGHRFPVASLFYVEPQLAFTASHIFGETFGAGQGVTVDQDSINSYVARAGIAAGIKCPDNMGSVWMKASYLYDFDGETNTTATQNKLKNSYAQDFGGSWYELGLGATVNFSKNLFGYADFEYAAGGEIETPWKYNVGVRYVY